MTSNKIDPIGFACLISKVAALRQEEMYHSLVTDFHDLVLGSIVEPLQVQTLLNPTIGALNDLVAAVAKKEFIPATKAYRQLTGWGLKEAKEAIEIYIGKPDNQFIQNA